MMLDSFENKGNHSLDISTSHTTIYITTDNRTCTKQPNAAV